MHLTRYNNPWNFLNNIQRDIYHANQTANPRHSNEDSENDSATWAPSVDISESEKTFTLLADIPGVDPKNIEISMDKGVLTIKGERNSVDIDEAENFRRVERQSGLFLRSFTLPESADAEKIEATSAHGVLTVTIPKQEVAVSRRIEVKH